MEFTRANLSKAKQSRLFNLLSLGQRGVGKTVFLAGSYTALKTIDTLDNKRYLSFECLEERDQRNLASILGYISQTGDYPPPTMKITDFNFNVKQRSSLGGTTTLCQFRWWDIPGEYTTFDHPDFQKMVLASHSCCVFINAARLVKDPEYRKELQGIIKQVVAIASFVDLKKIKYSFAIIFTQCDRLESGLISRLQIEQYLQPLNTALKSANANYQRFYSSIPIVCEQGSYQLKPSGASEAFLWLVSELISSHSQKPLAMALKENTSGQKTVTSKANRSLIMLTSVIGGLLVITTGVLLATGILSSGPKQITASDPEIRQHLQTLEKNPQDFPTLVALSTRYLELGELESAIPVMRKIISQRPQELEWRFNLARLYELREQWSQAEKEYEQILAQDPNHLNALLGKARLRQQQGDQETAQVLFQQAEQIAPNDDAKEKIRSMAQ